MKINTVVCFNENGKAKFGDASGRIFLYVGEVANNPQYVIVKGFRGKFSIGDEFIENIDDIRELTPEEVKAFFTPTRK